MEKGFSIQPYLTDSEILYQTAEQVKKDFSFFRITVHFDNKDETAYEQLCRQIMPPVKQLLASDYQKFYSLLYRVDISESQIKKESALSSNDAFEVVITRLIIKRCLQKVVLRKLFSQHD